MSEEPPSVKTVKTVSRHQRVSIIPR